MSSWLPRRLTPWRDWKYALSLERFCSQSSTKGISGLLFFPTAISHTISLVAWQREVLATPCCGTWICRAGGHCSWHTWPIPPLRIYLVYRSNEVVGISGMKHLWDNRRVLVSLLNNRSWNCRPRSLSSSIEIWTGLSIVCNTLDARPWMRDYFFSPKSPQGLRPWRPLECVSGFVCKTTHCVSSPTLHFSSFV